MRKRFIGGLLTAAMCTTLLGGQCVWADSSATVTVLHNLNEDSAIQWLDAVKEKFE